ncbi:aldehyde dehydrogenase family protein [Microbacterium sp. zg-Y818]|uniref:aldehyde dehydrogenase family protein n=1 Tax=unclassified Microbacterium TaxID=2609290 RepID=UPI00214C02FD|nr:MULTISPECIES: aldehyde dehydrogenase family protein [unclassified Microbacterium]MCR2799336.1 aldehyde dehydrogenase family protein [Microbacterium sp. zg.Y818]WIM21336.1 aldehyde dehydrogenase family protein [Microbacterium sp. zg-Y818]
MDAVTRLIEPALVIAGVARDTVARIEVEDPATGLVFATVADATPADLDDAFQAAAAAQPAWAARPYADRVALLEAVSRRLGEHADELAALLTREQGKPLANARGEVAVAQRWIAVMSQYDLEPEVLERTEEKIVELRREPIGVIAAITPWNVPLGLAAWKFVPALLAGNTMVLKPSPFTPVATARLGELVADILPAGVLTVVTGGDELGAAMSQHPIPRKVTMTGSVATGRKVAVAAGHDLKRVTLELGGNDPAIVLADADIADIAPRLFTAAFANNGQVCTAVKRIYAHDDVYDDLVAALAAIAAETSVGNGLDEGVRLGPLANRAQRDRVEGFVDAAVRAGARVAAGGRRLDRPGWFYQPTIVADLPEGTDLETQEQFGPAVPVIRYRDLDQAIARANAGDYGLGASVWGTDAGTAVAAAGRLEAGTVWVNAHLALSPSLPFGGHKHSGLGVENGLLGLHEYTRVRVVHLPITNGDAAGRVSP